MRQYLVVSLELSWLALGKYSKFQIEWNSQLLYDLIDIDPAIRNCKKEINCDGAVQSTELIRIVTSVNNLLMYREACVQRRSQKEIYDEKASWLWVSAYIFVLFN